MKPDGACLLVLHCFSILVVGSLRMSDEYQGFVLVSE